MHKEASQVPSNQTRKELPRAETARVVPSKLETLSALGDKTWFDDRSPKFFRVPPSGGISRCRMEN